MGSNSKSWVAIETDGGCKPNPGRGACGFVARLPGGGTHKRRWTLDGTCTSNIAEYQAVLGALSWAAQEGFSRVTIRSDSQLVVKTLNGTWRCQKPHIAALRDQARAMVALFNRVCVVWVPRERNHDADRLTWQR